MPEGCVSHLLWEERSMYILLGAKDGVLSFSMWGSCGKLGSRLPRATSWQDLTSAGEFVQDAQERGCI